MRSTVHGPIVSDVLETLDEAGAQAPTPEPAPFTPEGYAVSLSWTALTPGRTADAVFALNQATNWDEFRSAAELFEVPSQNLVYADTDGNIGYQAPGKIPVRRPGSGLGQADGTWPRPGWSSDWDWNGYIPFQDLPSVRNPDEGFIVAANQQVIGAEYRHRITSDWDYGYRSQRIRDVLTEKIAAGEKLDAADMNELQTDTTNAFADALVPSLLAAPPVDGDTAATRQFTAEAVQLLRGWDGSQPAAQTGDDRAGTSAAAAYFNAVWSNLLRLTFQDQLPESIHPDGGGRWFEVVTALLADKDNPWWDDASTPTITESRDQVIGQALKDARLELTASLGKDPAKWEWGKLHTLQLEQQPLGGEGIPAPVRGLFNSGSYRMGGGSSIVLATGWDASEQGVLRRGLGAVDAHGGRPRRPRPLHLGRPDRRLRPPLERPLRRPDRRLGLGRDLPVAVRQAAGGERRRGHPHAQPDAAGRLGEPGPARRRQHGVDPAVVRRGRHLARRQQLVVVDDGHHERPVRVPGQVGQRAVVEATALPEPGAVATGGERGDERQVARAEPEVRGAHRPGRVRLRQPQAAGQLLPGAQRTGVHGPRQIAGTRHDRQQHADPVLLQARPQ